MHFYYLDEAGCTERDLRNAEQPIFVLAGISVRDEGWNATQESLSRVISDYFSGTIPAGFELHAEELLSPEGDGPFVCHDRTRRNDLARKILTLLDDRSHDVHTIGIDKGKLSVAALFAGGIHGHTIGPQSLEKVGPVYLSHDQDHRASSL
jgi:hypothetical protein